ncbi:hypothetical protein OROHE_006936 [Orobanche hederae]
MVRGVRKKQVQSVEECSSRRKKHSGNSKSCLDHDIKTASETDFDVKKDVGKRQRMKKRPRDTPSESSENESMSMGMVDTMHMESERIFPWFECSDSGYSSENDPDIINEVLNASSTDYSSDGCEKEVQRDDEAKKQLWSKGVTYYRSNLKIAIDDISKLKFTEAHLERIKRTPIWFFFDAIYRKGGRKLMQKTDKVDCDTGRIIKCFDNRKSRFIIGGEVVPLTCRDVSLIFGITGGKLIIPVKNKRGPIVPWVRRHFGDEIERKTESFALSKTHLLLKLEKLFLEWDKTSIVDVARFVHCFLMASVLTPCQNSSVAWPVTEIVEDFDEVGKYNWRQYILDVLLKQMKTSLNMKLGGCAILLPYWLCEHTQIVKPSGEDLFPRFMKWDLQELKSSFSSLNLLKINPKKLRLENLKQTRDEKWLFMSLVDEIADSRRALSGTEGCSAELSGAKTQNASRGATRCGRDLLMELESLRQKNKELTEKIDGMNKEREIERSVHEQNEGQSARLNVEDIPLKDVSDQINLTVVLVDPQTSSLSPRNERLTPDLENYSIPTPTQIFSDPDNITKMDKIADLHYHRIGSANLQDEFDAEVCVPETQDVANGGGPAIETGIVVYREPFASAGSIRRGVKGRTMAGGRKSKVITPQMTTAELIKHTKKPVVDCDLYISNRVINSWELVAERDTNERKTLKHFVDDVLEESMENDFLMFPLWTKSDGKTTPREGGGKDVHLERAKILEEVNICMVLYIERKIKEIYGRSNPGVVFTKPKVMACLQQEATSVDCGVVVCSIIENLLSGKWMKSGTMAHASAGNFCKKMVEQFMVSPYFVKGGEI